MNKKSFGLRAAALRWIALACMLLDHLGRTIASGNDWMTILGRLAFPIFAFQIAEGYLHTHDYSKYRNRLLLFAAASEVPFDLMLFGIPFYPFHQNVMITLLLGLVCIHVIDQVQNGQTDLWLGCTKLAGLFLLGYLTFSDYGLLGILNVVVFFLVRNFPGAKLVQLAAMIAIHAFGFQSKFFLLEFLGLTLHIPIQSLAILSLIPIWLYNGEKGCDNQYLQYFSYIFYPLHMLVLYLMVTYLL